MPCMNNLKQCTCWMNIVRSVTGRHVLSFVQHSHLFMELALVWPLHQVILRLIIIMYIYHALISALSAHMIHINLNEIFYTHVWHSPTKTICITYYMETHTHSRNWVFILVGAEILWEEEGFQFGFKRWQGWAVSKVLWEWIPNVGSKAGESAKAMSLAFVLLDFQRVGVRERA